MAPAPPLPVPGPGPVAEGVLVGFPFGQMEARVLAALAPLGGLRVTPWRMLLVEGRGALPPLGDLAGHVLVADDPVRRVQACTGAPGCLQAHRPVRDLARRLAPQVPPGRVLHVSGCAKGCAHPARADLTVIATPRGFDVVRGGTTLDRPDLAGLGAEDIDLRGLI